MFSRVIYSLVCPLPHSGVDAVTVVLVLKLNGS